MIMSKQKQTISGRGGKRPGAGRPATGRTTRTIRVPNSFPDSQDLQETLEVLRRWDKKLKKYKPTSSRVKLLRELFSELPDSIFRESDD